MTKYRNQLADALKTAYAHKHEHGQGWREVAQEFFDDEIPFGTLNRIANSGGKYLPSVPAHLEKLLVPLNEWPTKALFQKQLLNRSNLKKRKQRAPKSIQSMSTKELLYCLENRIDL